MDKPMYAMDYVYVPTNSTDFEQLHIEFFVLDETFTLVITSEIPICGADILDIVNSLQRTQFRKLRVDIFEQGDVFLVIAAEKYRAVFGGECTLEKVG
ncbi:hypothetical protein AGMMS49975_04600 [Clostridia bacterium]|nr:hypothetical protein AGMMS49975_04600 [Clostridia bacterium]